MSYYKSETENKKALGVIDLSKCKGIAKADPESPKPNSFAIKTPGRVYIINAASSDEAQEWVHALEDAVPEDTEEDDAGDGDGGDGDDALLGIVNKLDDKLEEAYAKQQELEKENAELKKRLLEAEEKLKANEA